MASIDYAMRKFQEVDDAIASIIKNVEAGFIGDKKSLLLVKNVSF